MSYSRQANVINAIFIATIFFVPVTYCLYNNVAPEIGRSVIVISFLLGAFVIADWYHLYYGNTFKGILATIALGMSGGIIIAAVVASISESAFVEIFRFGDVSIWDGRGWLLRIFIASLGVTAAAMVGIPRLLVVKGFGGPEVPANDD